MDKQQYNEFQKQNAISSVNSRPPQITYFFYIRGKPVAMEEKEASEYYRKHKKNYIGRTNATQYKEDSIKLRARVLKAKKEEPERIEEIENNFRRALKKIFEWEVERAKDDKTPPPINNNCIWSNTNQNIKHLLR